MRWPRSSSRAATTFILVTVALDVLALGITIPVLPKLVEEMSGGDTMQAAQIFGLFGTAWALMQFVFQPILGALSDRFGRRPVILISNVGLGLDYIMMALAPNLAWLFAGRVISGIAAASFSTATAYIADVTEPAKRAQAFGLIGVAFGLGFILGPAIGGLLGGADPRLPFWVAAVASLLNAAYGYFVLPESLPPERRSPFRLRSANPVGAMRLLASHPVLLSLSSALFLYHVAHAVFPAVFVLHAGYRFGWGIELVGLALAAFGLSWAIVQGVLIKPAMDAFGEHRTMLIGFGAGIAGLLTLAFAPNVWVFWAGLPVMALWGFISPAAQSIMTRQVTEKQQGQLQGASSSLTSIASLLGPLLFTQTFAWAIAPDSPWQLPGAPFLVAAILITGAMALALRALRAEKPVSSGRDSGL